MHWLLYIATFVVCCFLIYRLPFFRNLTGLPFSWLLLLFGLKIIAGTFLIYIYTFYYPDRHLADIYKYFDDAKIMHSALQESPANFLRMLTGIGSSAQHLEVYYTQMANWYKPWDTILYNDNRLVIRFNAFILLFSSGNILIHSIVFNFLSFTGLVALFRFMAKYAEPSRISWLIPGIFLFPGLLFWGSGMLKEAMLLGLFGLWIWQADLLITSKRCSLKGCLLLAFGTILLFLLKPYTLLLFVPCFFVFYVARNFSFFPSQLIWLSVFVFLILTSLIIGILFPAFDFRAILASKQNEFIFHSLYHNAGSLMHSNFLKPNIPDILVAFMVGLFHALFRPIVFEVNSIVTLMAAIENLFILIILVVIVFRFDKETFLKNRASWLSLWFVIVFMGLVGMLSPAYGGLVRYKIPALPFLWFAMIHALKLPRFNKLEKVRSVLSI